MLALKTGDAIDLLNEIMELELGGVIRYTHYSLMVTGPYRMPLVEFMQDSAQESLGHAQEAGELLTGLDGHPSLSVAHVDETHHHDLDNILHECIAHEQASLELYRRFLELCSGASIYLEDFARGKIAQEEVHQMQLRKMLRDFR